MSVTAWVTVAQASDILGMSERSVRRHVADGSLPSKLEGGRRFVKVEMEGGGDGIVGMTTTDRDALIKWLKDELRERDGQIENLQEEIKVNRERSDTILMRLTEELAAQRGVFEGRQAGKKGKDSFWRRQRGKKNADGDQ